MKKSVFIVMICFILLIIVGCAKEPTISDENLEEELGKLSDEELEKILDEGESEQDKALAGQATQWGAYRAIGGKQVKLNRLTIATQKVYRKRLKQRVYQIERVQPFVRVDAGINCGYETAAELLATCPTAEERRIIRRDFNIAFDQEPPAWDCTNGGDESSIMLSMYNTFRLMKCIPFDENFIWAPQHNNLYDWMKSLNLDLIQYFSCPGGGCFNHAGGRNIYLMMDNLGNLEYRQVVNPQMGNGLGFAPVLIVHEARHTTPGGNKPHTCGSNDNTLNELGAWGVQHHLLNMLADNTGNFFSNYEKNTFRYSAQNILNTRFCS